MLRTLTLGVMFAISSTSYAKDQAITSMTQLEGSWKAKKVIDESVTTTPARLYGATPITDLGGWKVKFRQTDICQIEAVSDVVGMLRCDQGDVVKLTLSGKQITMEPQVQDPYFGFKEIIQDGWTKAYVKIGFISPKAVSAYAPKADRLSSGSTGKMNLSSSKKLTNGSVFVSGIVSSKLCQPSNLGRPICLPGESSMLNVMQGITYTSLIR